MIFATLIMFVVGFLIMKWVLKQKTGEKYSKKSVTKFFMFGVLATVLALILAEVFRLERDTFFDLNPFLGGFLTSLLTAALLEEVSKYIFFRLAIFKNEETKCWLDVIIASTVVGIGFTLMEDVTYSMFGDGNVIRAFLPMHILFQIIMGYFYGKARVNKSFKNHVLALVAPILCHTLYDTFLLSIKIVVEKQGVEEVTKLTAEELMTKPYFNELVVMFCGAIIVTIVLFVLMIVLLRKISVWSKRGEKQETI